MTAPTELERHFSTSSSAPQEQASRWHTLWQQDITPWDRGRASPALIDILSQRTDLIGTATATAIATGTTTTTAAASHATSRRKALIPGCGTGYDAHLLRARGWDVTGLDVSLTAVERARAFGERIHDEREASRDDGGDFAVGVEGMGSLEFQVGDFFALSEDWYGRWDLIWDYTFLCALPLDLRPKWAAQMARLLSPTGRLVCLEFPLHKSPTAKGPPWPLRSETYLALLSRPGDEIKYGDDGLVLPEDQQSLENQLAMKRIAHFKPDRTFEAGKESDRVSVWSKR